MKCVLALGVGSTLLSGCVAAAFPLVAGGVMAQQTIGKETADAPRAKAGEQGTVTDDQGRTWTISPATELPPPTGLPTPTGLPAPPGAVEAVAEPDAAMRYLYGSGEAAALGVQAYQALGAWLKDRAMDKANGQPGISTILARGATLDRPKFVPCDDKPPAVVFDIDETVLLNLGFESHAARTGAPYDEGRWQRWESTGAGKVAAVPGALEAIAAARGAGITVVFNSNRSAVNAAATAAALQSAGLGSAVHGDTLWLKGDAGTGSGKDERRWRIAEKYCVVALVGDQLGDFSDLFNTYSPISARRGVAVQPMVAPLWGSGWFILPNPVYGSAVAGSFDQIFPAEKRWSDPAGE